MEALISNETFLKTALLLGWLAIVMLTTSVARYKNRTPAWGWLSLLLGVIALVWLILLPKVNQKKAALKTRRELIIINHAYSMGVWKRKVNNSNLMGLYTKVLRKNEGVDLEYLDSFIKVTIE